MINIDKEEKIRIAIYLEEETYDELKETAKEYNTSMSEVVRMAINDYVEKYSKPKRK